MAVAVILCLLLFYVLSKSYSNCRSVGTQTDMQEESEQCIICFDNAIAITLVPCGHYLACEDCAQQLHECPVCRSAIARRQRTYMCSM